MRELCPPFSWQITTGYNLEDDRCECVALQDFRAGEQVGISHGIANRVWLASGHWINVVLVTLKRYLTGTEKLGAYI